MQYKDIFLSSRFCLFLSAFFILLLRLPWINYDAGFSSFWGYGYFVTDEFYYTIDARLAYLTGQFFSPFGESLSFYKMPMTNILAFFSYNIFGLHLWSLRIPMIALSLVAWLTIYKICEKRTTPWIASICVIIVSSMPPCIVYERTMSTDFAMSAFAIFSIGFIQNKKSYLNICIASLFLTCAYFTKISILGLVPLIILLSWHYQGFLKTTLLFGLSITLILLGLFSIDYYVGQVSEGYNVGLKEALILGDRVTSAPQLSLDQLSNYINTLSVTPRWPVIGKVSFFLIFGVLFPVYITIYKLITRPFKRWHKSEIYSLGIVAFIVAASLHVFSNVRYLAPIYMLTPIILIEGRKFFRFSSGFDIKKVLLGFASIGLILVLIHKFFPILEFDKNEISYSQFIPPKTSLWKAIWPRTLFYSFLGAIFSFFVLPYKRRKIPFVISLFFVFIVVSHLLHVNLPIIESLESDRLSIFIRKIDLLLLIQFSFILCIIISLSHKIRIAKYWYGLISALVISTYLFNPFWNTSISEMYKRRTYMRKTSTALVEKIPKESIVISDRGIFLESDLTCIPHASANDNVFWSMIEKRLNDSPDKRIFALLDPHQNQPWRELQDRRSTFKLLSCGIIKLPGFASAALVENILVEIKLKSQEE